MRDPIAQQDQHILISISRSVLEGRDLVKQSTALARQVPFAARAALCVCVAAV